MKTFLISILPSIFYYQGISQPLQTLKDADSLKKYSYLLFGLKKNSTSAVQGTAFFIRQNGKLYLMTASHLLEGFSSLGNAKDVDYPDTIFVRVNYLNARNVNAWPIDIRQLKKRSYKPFYKTAHISIIEFKRPYPTKDTIYSVEKLIDEAFLTGNAIINIEAALSGYPAKASLQFDQKPSSAAATAYYDPNPFLWTNIKYKDTINYQLSLKTGNAAGYGGSPVFFKLLIESNGERREKYIFGGMCFAGIGQKRTAYGVRPLAILKMLSAYK